MMRKIKFGKLVYSKNLKKKPQPNPTIARKIIRILIPNKYLVKFFDCSISFFLPAPNLMTK